VRTQDRLGVTVTAPGKQFEGAAAVRIGTAIVASGRHRCTVTIIAPTRRGSLAGGSRLATTPPPQRAPWPTDQRRTCRLGSMLAEAHRQKKAPVVPGRPVVSNKGETLEGGKRPHPPNVIAPEPFRGLHLCHRNPQRPYSLISRSASACSNAQLAADTRWAAGRARSRRTVTAHQLTKSQQATTSPKTPAATSQPSDGHGIATSSGAVDIS